MKPSKTTDANTTGIHLNELRWKKTTLAITVHSNNTQSGETANFLTLNCMREVTGGMGSVRLGRGCRSVESLTLRDILCQTGP
jgi:hypothetical protein